MGPAPLICVKGYSLYLLHIAGQKSPNRICAGKRVTEQHMERRLKAPWCHGVETLEKPGMSYHLGRCVQGGMCL